MAFSIRYAIPMNGPGCEASVRNKLKSLQNVDNIEIDLPQKEVVITGNVSPSAVVSAMQTIGRDAFVRGSGRPNSAAVAILETSNGLVKGLARIIEVEQDKTLFDLSIDDKYKSGDASVYSYGDISNPPSTLGERLFKLVNLSKAVKQSPQSTVSSISVQNDVALSNLIGRSIHTDSGLTGIIARSAGLWENDKTVCTCSGKTVWEERQDFREKSSGNL